MGFKLVIGFGTELVSPFTTLIDSTRATTTYLYEQRFSAPIVEIKSKKKNAMKDVDMLMQGALKTRPRFSQLAGEIQQQRLH